RGDRAFFYHSNEGLAVVGIVEVVKEYYPDPSDASGRFGMVDVKPARPFKRPVTLAEVKAEPNFAELPLIRQAALSVMPIDDTSWRLIGEMGGVKACAPGRRVGRSVASAVWRRARRGAAPSGLPAVRRKSSCSGGRDA